jgi:anti-sigma factor RsiW
LFAHPSTKTLIESLDGELAPKRNIQVKAHVARCAACHDRLDQLQEQLESFRRSAAATTPAFSVEEGLARLSSAISERNRSFDSQAQVDPEPKPSPALYARLLSELSIYLGRHTATDLLERCNHALQQRDRLSAVIEPVVTTFLGQHTGATVLANVLRIWDNAQLGTT